MPPNMHDSFSPALSHYPSIHPQLVSSSTPKFQPALCRKSLEMSEQHFKGEFLDRVERDVLRRTDSESRLLASGRADNGCTFHPNILEKSERLRGRSSYEMSRGDLLRRETNQRMMKLRLEREELAELTFQPEISFLAKNTESALRLKENPRFFLEYHKSTQARRLQMKEKERHLKEEKELQSCTFNPVTIDCPSYVKRIARSMAAVKAAAAQNKGEYGHEIDSLIGAVKCRAMSCRAVAVPDAALPCPVPPSAVI